MTKGTPSTHLRRGSELLSQPEERCSRQSSAWRARVETGSRGTVVTGSVEVSRVGKRKKSSGFSIGQWCVVD